MATLAAGLSAARAEPGKISVEFNDLQAADTGCRAVFVLNNGLDKPLAKLALRVVAFDTAEHATLFLTLDVGALPVGKTRELRFDLGEGVACDSIGRLVLDDVTACEGAGLDPAGCLAAVALASRAKAPFAF
jgi:hypothetical protein